MSKYARFIDHSAEQDGSDIRVVDVVDTDAYDPRPEWGQTDDDLLSRIFANHKDEWVAAQQWFVQVHQDVVAGAVFEHGGDPMDAGAYTAPHFEEPHKQTVLTITAFKKRLTFSEKAAILGSEDIGVKTFLDELNTAKDGVDLTDPDTIRGVEYMVELRLLTPERATAILTP